MERYDITYTFDVRDNNEEREKKLMRIITELILNNMRGDAMMINIEGEEK